MHLMCAYICELTIIQRIMYLCLHFALIVELAIRTGNFPTKLYNLYILFCYDRTLQGTFQDNENMSSCHYSIHSDV